MTRRGKAAEGNANIRAYNAVFSPGLSRKRDNRAVPFMSWCLTLLHQIPMHSLINIPLEAEVIDLKNTHAEIKTRVLD